MEILLVEDRPEDVELTKLALMANGFKGKFHHVEDGQEAIDFLFDENNLELAHNLNLILLDINLPKLSGFEVLKRIKNSSLKHVPVVMLSTSAEKKDVTEAYSNYANSYTVKPVGFSDFQQLMSTLSEYWVEHNITPILS
ncbi:MAG: response regulator [Cyclobacteriaceae bacterium]